ncbi:hypothetical protein AX16_007444 [Volvariella volvacea WC 439]|nr:hypothetical protein AX16_007444 [Volvariella volvacea WC 439]
MTDAEGRSLGKLPGFGLPLNHVLGGYIFPTATDTTSAQNGGAALTPLTLREIRMLQLMNVMTDKLNWGEKVFSTEVITNWRREVFAGNHKDVTTAMIEWCISEVQFRTTLLPFKEAGAVSVFNGDVLKSDTAVEYELKAALCKAIKHLEDVPDKEKDWHPGSDGKILDLVHPSLFPLVYGRTRVLEDDMTDLEDFVKKCGKGVMAPVPEERETKSLVGSWAGSYRPYSRRFQWLPCEVSLEESEQGKVRARITSYINNLHPGKFSKLYDIIEKVIARAIPLWNATLTAVRYGPYAVSIPRIKFSRVSYQKGTDGEGSTLHIPDAPVFEIPSLRGAKRFDLVKQFKDKGLQVIVKLANIHLTPGKPEYEGGTWHVEGQLVSLFNTHRELRLISLLNLNQNERICATALYYYDNENITPSHLAFRQQCDEFFFDNLRYDQDDHGWLGDIFGMDDRAPAVQEVGSVETREGRLITFPNILQHQVQPFKLADPTKPGHRKILALFLVDPHVRVISTANVPCQRMDWWIEEVRQDAPMNGLPVEVQDMVFGGVDEFPIGLEEAKETRLELMEERKKFVLDHGRAFEAIEISLCEH